MPRVKGQRARTLMIRRGKREVERRKNKQYRGEQCILDALRIDQRFLNFDDMENITTNPDAEWIVK
jgi:hypothetical protein